MAVAIVSKQLRKTDIKKRLTIPSKSLKDFPSLAGKHKETFKARDDSGRTWKFQIYTRKRNRYLKPVLTRGWLDFVRAKEVAIGDKVEFYKEEKEQGANKYRVKTEQKQMWHPIDL
ncbi:hypothetical protein ES288_D02G288300v1 [Gossypium darwinii]|uniref:TF-B3 domain-containing protein n=1 Tax=Gossypium darwinii TaxID=34276 RepID=A0A5D2DHW8_GOSDA|nr:hypothetical protein ES288_D02G288300v1 [Gossypium darwinii]